ncbi:hypothetical protein [Actinomadura miaoliensis]|uniref:C2H2-type domain-containing protein n=1 Tax=Actinomadura miaoliensis TaxID=430685 RepID=A0ABP7V4U6_9ACTN
MKHFDISQPVATASPIVSVYYACTLPGCGNRFFLPEDQRMRSLSAHAERAGWHVEIGAERCPDHLPGRPLQLEPARLDPTATLPDALPAAPTVTMPDGPPPVTVLFNQPRPVRRRVTLDLLRRVLDGLLRLDEPSPRVASPFGPVAAGWVTPRSTP